jgi:hypothetical protein
MTETIAGSVFMSYSRKDDHVMRRTTAFLRGKGLAVWVDNEKLIPGTPIWEAEIEKAIRSASAVVIFMSPDSKDSEWVRREISLADQYRKRIFPVLVNGDEDTSITLRLVTRQFVDLRGNEKTGLNSLHQAVSQYINELNVQLQGSPTEGVTSTHVTTPDTSTFDSGKSASSSSTSPLAIWLAVGWAVCGVIAGFLWSEFDDIGGWFIAGLFGGGGGGLFTALILRSEKVIPDQISTIRGVIAWAIGGSMSWLIGWQISDGPVAGGFGMAVMAMAGLAGTLGMDHLRVHWQGTATIILAWFIGGALIWIISNTVLIDSLSMDDKGLAWGIGTAIAWAIGGYVMGRQLLKKSTNS